MSKADSLILLVASLSKSEKKAIVQQSEITQGTKAYMELFNLIDREKISDATTLRTRFAEENNGSSFHPVVAYLYDFVLQILLRLRINQDRNIAAQNKLLTAQILRERKLDRDYHNLLKEIVGEAKEVDNYTLLLGAQRQELNFLRENNFLGMTEKELLKKHHEIGESLNILRQINGQSFLYELLLLRIEETPLSQAAHQNQYFSDLVISEISLVSNLKRDVFEIQKLHQLFQANYLIHVADYKSALNAFTELEVLFSANKAHWDNPPYSYVRVLEGILSSLFRIGKYEQMDYFLEKLRAIECRQIAFRTRIAGVDFVFTINRLIAQNRHSECEKVMRRFKTSLINRIDQLTPEQYLLVSMTIAKALLLNSKHILARKQIIPILNSESYRSFWLYRVIELLDLAVLYEMKNIVLISSIVRSLRRKNKIEGRVSLVEEELFSFVSYDLETKRSKEKNSLRESIVERFKEIKEISEERRLLEAFDFEAWMLKQLE